MFRSGKWALVAAIGIWILGAQEAKAGIGFQPVSSDELKMTSEPLAPGAPAIILYRQVDRDDNSRTSHEDNYFRIKIFTEEGRKHADIEIPFFKGNENVANVRGRTIRPDGSIVNFEGKVFEKELVKGRGVKYLAKTFTLPDVQVGGIIEYFYTVDLKEQYIFDSHWILSDELFTKKAQFSLKPYSSSYSTFYLRWSWSTLPAGAAPPAQGPDRIVRMEASNIPAFQTEDYMPPPNELKSRVDFIYESNLMEKDQASFWKHFGKERNGQLESFVGKRKAMEQAVAQIVSPSDSQEVKLRKIYDRVQQIRNTSYELEKTEQDHTPGSFGVADRADGETEAFRHGRSGREVDRHLRRIGSHVSPGGGAKRGRSGAQEGPGGVGDVTNRGRGGGGTDQQTGLEQFGNTAGSRI